MNQSIRNALDDLETAAEFVRDDYNADFEAETIEESVKTIREELE